MSKITDRLKLFARRRHRPEDEVLLTILIGVLVSITVVGFIVLTERLGARLFPRDAAAWRRIVIPVAGSLLMGYILYWYAPDAQGGGIVETKIAMFLRKGRISLRTVVSKFFLTSGTLASGIPLGPEGPAVHVGAGIASVLGRRLGLSPEKVKALIPVGGAAAIAAAFNAPLAGVLYALEELVGDLHAPVLGSVVLGAATSWLVLRLLLGNEPLFHVPQYDFVNPLEFGIYAILGLAGGCVSVLFARLLVRFRLWFRRLPVRSRWYQPVAGGLLVALIGFFVPEVLGVGYVWLGQALNGQMALSLMAALVLLKLLTVTMAYSSGNVGGIFAPSLFLGAMLGGALGSVAHQLLPAYTATAGAYALVGMGAVFAGIVRAPMTSVIMIFEVTHDYAVIVPLMIANLISFYIVKRAQPETIYEQLSHIDGIHLPSGRAREQSGLHVVDAMRPPAEVFHSDDLIAAAAEVTRPSKFRSWIVMDDGRVAGVVSRSDFQLAHENGLDKSPLRQILKSGLPPHVHEDQSLETALQRLGINGLDVIPVVSRANVHELIGVVALSDILEKYGVNGIKADDHTREAKP
jgi:chloride channel protein, CIC family